ncbi:hypothetical protein BaRGS_00032382 [Batillaria attramentaria]|uniref:Fibrinogen C-terminal domain-containing protein n=1 Tax=Batillaria attramentaria TaxID=370345 RepID=A0ABD0JN87_9CAEN
MSGFLVLAVFLLSTSPVPSSSQQAPDFTLCPRGSVFTGPELTSLSGGSAADCAKNCSQTSGCEAFNVCPDHMSGAVTCHLLSDNNPQGCAGLSPSPFPDCRYVARCALGNKGSQYVLVRTTMSFDVTWATATAGIGDPAAGDFFIGLDKLHYLTQTLRSIHFFMWSTTGSKHIINYYDFTVGPESSSYQLSYR